MTQVSIVHQQQKPHINALFRTFLLFKIDYRAYAALASAESAG